jgi:type I restriction enzyme S subunit
MIELALKDVFDLQQGFAFKSKDFQSEGVPILKIKNVKSSGLSLHQLDYVDERFIETHSKYIPAHGDALISMSGNRLNGSKETWVGKVCLFYEKKPFLVNQRVGILKNKNEKVASTAFLVYALSSEYWQLRFAQTATSSGGQANLSNAQILDESVFLPSLSEQKAIAHILGTLDDKIELNQKMSQTLEDIAKAIFKSWFVDFDPVRAKAEGRPTGLSAEISDLFPNTLVDTELGQIPNGWTRCNLGALVTPQRGKTITKSKCVEGGIPVVAGGLAPAYYHNVANVSAPVVTISASGANAGFARLYHEDIWASDCSYISKRQSRFVYIWYIFLKMNQSKIYHMQQGAAQPHIYPSDLMRMEVVCPEDEIMWNHLDTIVTPLFERISICDTQNKVLVDLRDTLLPKLISGELPIPDADKFLEEAGV